MNNTRVRKIINEEVKKQLSRNAFGEEFEYVIREATLNELDVGDMFSSGLSFVSDNFGDASINAVKQFLITELFLFLERAGFPIQVDSIFGSVLINVLQNLTASDMAEYFSDEGCSRVADRIITGVQEGLQEDVVINRIVELFFGPGAKLEGLLGSPIRELINLKLNDMTNTLREPIVTFACDHRDFEKLKDDLMSGISTGETNTGITRDNERRSILRMK